MSDGSSDSPPLLALRHLRKRYGGVRALVDASLVIARPGEVHTLLGENGSGKSTLLGVLSGQVRADAGMIELDGRTVRFRDPVDALRQGIAMVSQESAVAPHLSVTENVLLGRLPGGRGRVNWLTARSTVSDLLDELGLQVDPDAQVGSLPPDQRQLVEIARALSVNARVVVLDEPTSSLTGDEVEHLYTAIERLRNRGVAIVFVSHRLDEVFRISDTITVLRAGATVASRPAADFTPDSLVSAMVGESFASQLTPVPLPLGVGHSTLTLSGLSCAGAFSDIDLAVAPGEIVGLAGLVGSGRSDLLEAIFGARPRSAGTMELSGKAYSPRHERDGIEAGVAFLPPDRKTQGLILQMSVLDNLGVVSDCGRMRLRTPDRRRLYAAFVKATETVRLHAGAPLAPVRTLSGGNQQKVAIAKWLGVQPRLLLADEPTRGVDVAAKAEIHERIRAAASSGLSVLVSSSENPELLMLCHRVLVMSRGRIVGSVDHGSAGSFTENRISALAGGQL